MVVAERGQVTIPKALRQTLGIGAGTVLEFAAENGRLIAVKTAAGFVQSFTWNATDDPLLAESATGRFYYHADARGSVSLMTDEAGTSGAWRRYDPWSRVLGGAGTPPQYGYTENQRGRSHFFG